MQNVLCQCQNSRQCLIKGVTRERDTWEVLQYIESSYFDLMLVPGVKLRLLHIDNKAC